MHVRQQVLLLILPHHYFLRQLPVVVKLPIYHLKYKHYNIYRNSDIVKEIVELVFGRS